jgi:hypothetical protein
VPVQSEEAAGTFEGLMSVANFFFFVGGLLQLWCGSRAFIRFYQSMQARGAAPKTDPMSDLIARIKVKDTFVRDVFGWLAGAIMMIIAFIIILPVR